MRSEGQRMNRYGIAALEPKPDRFMKLATTGIKFRDSKFGYLCFGAFFINFLKALSAPSSVLSASALCAASRKRLYCAGSSGLRGVEVGFCLILFVLPLFSGPKPRASECGHTCQSTDHSYIISASAIANHATNYCAGKQAAEPQGNASIHRNQ